MKHDTGVLSATTAFGKTVVAAWLIAQRRVNTLVLVHRRQLLDQWVQRVSTFLDVPPKSIGQIGGGRHRPTGLIDVAVFQSLVGKGIVDDSVANYGHLIIDECHHVSAHSFEQVVRRAKARYILGLSATVARKDGHHPPSIDRYGGLRAFFVRDSAASPPGTVEHTRRYGGLRDTCPAQPLGILLPLVPQRVVLGRDHQGGGQASQVRLRGPLAPHLPVRLHGTLVEAVTDETAAAELVSQADAALAGRHVCLPCSIGFRVAASMAQARTGTIDAVRRRLEDAERIARMWPGGSWHAAVCEARGVLRRAEGDCSQPPRRSRRPPAGSRTWAARATKRAAASACA